MTKNLICTLADIETMSNCIKLQTPALNALKMLQVDIHNNNAIEFANWLYKAFKNKDTRLLTFADRHYDLIVRSNAKANFIADRKAIANNAKRKITKNTRPGLCVNPPQKASTKPTR